MWDLWLWKTNDLFFSMLCQTLLGLCCPWSLWGTPRLRLVYGQHKPILVINKVLFSSYIYYTEPCQNNSDPGHLLNCISSCHCDSFLCLVATKLKKKNLKEQCIYLHRLLEKMLNKILLCFYVLRMSWIAALSQMMINSLSQVWLNKFFPW